MSRNVDAQVSINLSSGPRVEYNLARLNVHLVQACVCLSNTMCLPHVYTLFQVLPNRKLFHILEHNNSNIPISTSMEILVWFISINTVILSKLL